MKRMVYILIVAIVVVVALQMGRSEGRDNFVIRILKAVDHPALNAVELGIRDELSARSDIEIFVESAQGNVGLASQISARFANQGADVVVGIGTMPSQCLSRYALAGAFKLVYSSVTDPAVAGLTGAINVCGVSNFIDLEPQLELFCSLQLNLTRLGMLYNPAESNSVAIVQKMRTLCVSYGIELIEVVVQRTADIAQAVVRLISSVDAIFVSNDNTVLSALNNVTMIAKKYKKPVYVSDTDAVDRGCLCALGPNQYQIGRQTGKMILKALYGNIGTAVEYPSCSELFINESVAAQLNIDIPAKYLDCAIIIKDGGDK